jgi:hypothetical protein
MYLCHFQIEAAGKKEAELIKSLHQIIYRRAGKASELAQLKKNILEFNGFEFNNKEEQDKIELDLINRCSKWQLSLVKSVMGLLCIPRAGSKDDCLETLASWLLKVSALFF